MWQQAGGGQAAIAGFGQRLGLVAHVDLRPRILAHQDHRQRGLAALLVEFLGLGRKLAANARRECFPINDLGCHDVPFAPAPSTFGLPRATPTARDGVRRRRPGP